MSFYTSLSGLKASQTEMSTISHNLANVSTNGFKRSRTEFADVIASSVSLSPTQMVGSGTVVKAIRQQFAQGGLIQSTSSLDLAVSGEGFFAVKPNLDSASVAFTRNGGFSVSADRYVVDSNGGHLQVYPVDGSGTVVATGLGSTVNLRLPQTSGTPDATENVSIAVNLSSNAALPANNPVFTATNPYAFDRFNPATYNNSSQTTVFDANGNALTMTNYYVRDTAASGDAADQQLVGPHLRRRSAAGRRSGGPAADDADLRQHRRDDRADHADHFRRVHAVWLDVGTAGDARFRHGDDPAVAALLGHRQLAGRPRRRSAGGDQRG